MSIDAKPWYWKNTGMIVSSLHANLGAHFQGAMYHWPQPEIIASQSLASWIPPPPVSSYDRAHTTGRSAVDGQNDGIASRPMDRSLIGNICSMRFDNVAGMDILVTSSPSMLE